MSDFTQKHHRDLMEAYASIYQQSVQEETVENIEYQEYEIDADFILESVKHYLINFGYAENEKKAISMIPHLSEGWFNDIVGTVVINEHFIECVNSFIEEGCDLSSYTWDELYEEYTSHLSNVITLDNRNLNEVTGALAPLLSTPLGAGAALGASALGTLGKIKKDVDYLRTSKQWGYGDPASKRWLETGSFEARKERDPARVKASREAAQRAQQQRQQAAQTAQKPQGKTTQVTRPQITGDAGTKPSGGTAAGGAPPSGPTPPKGPNVFQKAASDFAKAFKQSSKPPSGPGTPPSGPTKPNPFMTAAGKLGGALYQGARPILKSAAAGTGALGAIGAVAGTADELAFRGAGRTALRKTLEFTRQAGPAMRGENPASAPTPPISPSATDVEKERRRIQNLFPGQGK